MIWPDPTEVGDVYQPAEDSELLARAAREQMALGDRVLEVGTGSGYVAGSVAETGATVVASDVNPHACRQARENYGPPADGTVTVVRGDLTTPFEESSFDAVLFNPPYLPTEEEAEREDWMATALSGGESGREVIDRFLEDVGRVLTPDGFALVLVSSLAGVEEVVATADGVGFSAAVVREESYPFETLSILKLLR